jgi:glycosyltransferase involved in cell wall biosynthesis
MRLAIVASHPIQYQAPLFRKLATMVDVDVLYAFTPRPEDQALAGFSVAFDWDIDLLSGYNSRYLNNVAASPSISFSGCDTPSVGVTLREGRYDAVLILGWYLKAFVQAAWACKRAGIPVMVRGDNHLLEPRSKLKQTLKAVVYPPALRIFDAALYVGQRSHAYFRHYGFPEKRLFFSPHSVDENAFSASENTEARARVRAEHAIPADAPCAVFVGKLVNRKRVADLIHAAARLRNRSTPLHVIVAGSGPLESELRTLADALLVDAHFLGFQNQSAMPTIYAAADIMVLPSDNESWGLVANEALSSGRPLILSDLVGCAPDLAGDGETGRVFQTGNIDSLASAIGEVLRAPPSPEALAERARIYSTQTAAEGVIASATYAMRESKP